MRTLTPAHLLPAHGQVSLIHELALPDIPSPTTPCAPVPALLLSSGQASPAIGLGLAIAGSSDFAHYSQSHQSHKAVSSSFRWPFQTIQFYGLSVHFQLLSTPCHHDAVTFSYWRVAPPDRDSHPAVHAHSQAHESGNLLPVSTTDPPTNQPISHPNRKQASGLQKLRHAQEHPAIPPGFGVR